MIILQAGSLMPMSIHPFIRFLFLGGGGEGGERKEKKKKTLAIRFTCYIHTYIHTLRFAC